jgi:hypothetical protein
VWAAARAGMPLASFWGQVSLIRSYAADANIRIVDLWASLPGAQKFFLAVLAFQAAVFAAAALGLLLSRRWGWLGMLWSSAAVLVWNLRAWIPGGMGSLSWRLPVYSLVALMLTYWLLNRAGVREHYRVQGSPPTWINARVGSVPIFVAVGIALFVAMAPSDVSAFLVYTGIIR